MQGLSTLDGGSMAGSPPDLTVPLPTAKDAIVNLSLPDGAGGWKPYKTHLGNLTRHSGFFAAASRQGTELKVRNGAHSLDFNCRGFDKLLAYMRSGGELPSELTQDDLALLHKLGRALDMSGDFWRALALHPAARGTADKRGGPLCDGGAGGSSGGSLKGILKHGCGGGNGHKRRCAAAELADPAPPLIMPRAKAYRRVLVDDLADVALCERPFFNGEWYGQPAEMRVVDTYDAEAPDDHVAAEKQESSSADPKQHFPAEPVPGTNGGSGCTGGAAATKAAATQAAAAASALLDGQPLLRVRRFALLEFTFEAASSCKD